MRAKTTKIVSNQKLICHRAQKNKKLVARILRLWYIHTCAGVVKLADALDSKSCGLIIRVGSSPTAGTNEKTTLQTTVRLFFHISAQAECLHSRLCGYMKKDSA